MRTGAYGNHSSEITHCNRSTAVRVGAISKLAIKIGTPVPYCSVGLEGNPMTVPCRNRHYVINHPGPHGKNTTATCCAIAQLTDIVVAPTPDGSVRFQRQGRI